MTFSYDGSDFKGYQKQPKGRTVQGEIESVLKKINGDKEVGVVASGRTDAGVHALGNVISFQSEKEVRINQINHSLPDDIQIIAMAPVRFGFKPRYAEMRWYRYILFEKDLDIDLMNQVAEIFKGTHNFTKKQVFLELFRKKVLCGGG